MQQIIIGVDDTDRSEDAVALGRVLALASGSSVRLVHVHPWATRAVELYEQHFAERSASLFARLAPLVADVPSVESVALPGPSAVQILQGIADEHPDALLVVGSSHTGHLGRVCPGGTAERLLNGAPCPVAVAPAGFRDRRDARLETLGCAWDGSPESEVALALGLGLRELANGTLRILRVFEKPEWVHLWPVLSALHDPSAELREEARQALDRRVAELGASAAVRGELRSGETVPELVAASDELDVLIVGSRGYGPLGAVLLGGVSGKVIRESRCPVIVHPRPVASP